MAPKVTTQQRAIDGLPDVRDGLTHVQRVVLRVLSEAQKDFGRRAVPTAALYGRVVEEVPLSEQEFAGVLGGLMGRT